MHRKQKLVHIEQEPETIILKILAFGDAPHIPQVSIVGPGDRVYHLEKL
jgi:hypothetical protein